MRASGADAARCSEIFDSVELQLARQTSGSDAARCSEILESVVELPLARQTCLSMDWR